MDCISSRQESIEAGIESRFLISEIRYARFVILFALCKDTLTNEPLLQSFQKQQSKNTFKKSHFFRIFKPLSILFVLTTFQLLSLVCNRIFFSPSSAHARQSLSILLDVRKCTSDYLQLLE